MRRDAIGKRRKLRRSAHGLPDQRSGARTSLRFHHLHGDPGHLLAAAGEHHAERIDEADAGATDHLRGHGLEIEAGHVFRQPLAQCLAAGSRLRRLLRVRLLY